MKTVEYRVKAVVRYVVTRYESDPETGSGGVSTMGEFDHGDYASRVCSALSKADPGPIMLPMKKVLENIDREQGADDCMAADSMGEWFERKD